ncbi:MAG: PepSY-associated TM helix domain-containing protein, partial [Bacteroidota bacterium]
MIRFYGAEKSDTSQDRSDRFAVMLHPQTLEVTSLRPAPTSVSETLYHLHYFDQIPFGLWISGFTALFFLFAIVTGVLIHWQDIVKRFYGFSIKTTAKQIWTLGYTTVAFIGLPYQIAYAITGALFGLLTLLLAPSAFILFDGDTTQVLGAVAPERSVIANPEHAHLPQARLNDLHDSMKVKFADYALISMTVRGYGSPEGLVTFNIDDDATLTGNGALVMGLAGGRELVRVDPETKGYTSTVYNLLLKLHFATFGGPIAKFVYFILAMLTCFMLISGILLWQKARDNARYTPKQRRFHFRVTKIYICICMALFPATALLFLVNKLIPIDTPGHASMENMAFFASWLVFILVGMVFGKNLRRIFRGAF